MKKVPGIQDVAAEAGVSISTVSRVLNHSGNVADNLRRRVYKAVESTGYSANPIASNLKSTKRNQIAVVIPTLRGTYYTDIIKGVSEYFYEKSIMSVVLESGGNMEKESSIIKDLEKQWIDGIILIPGQCGQEESYRKYMESLSHLRKRDTPIPVVLVEADGRNEDLDLVRVDHEAAFYAMAEHLLELGRRKLAYLGDAEDASLVGLALKGIRRAMEEYDCSLSEQLVCMGNSTVLDGYQSMARLLYDGQRPDGVICTNDQVAAGALNACKEQGLLSPKDVAVTGYGGMALSIVTDPPITTMVAPRQQMGTAAAQLLYERIEGNREEPRRIILAAHPAIRCSTMKSAFRRLETMFDD